LNSTATELSGFEFVAAQFGQTAESFENALGKMTQKIGEAREGSEKTSVAFQAMGLDVNRLAGLSAGGAFEEIGERFRELPNAADRAALAVELFGKRGKEVIPILMEGRAEIEKQIDRGREMGAVMGEEMVIKLALGQQAIIDFKKSIEGFGNKVATEMSGPLKWFVDNVLGWYVDRAKDAIELTRLASMKPKDFFEGKGREKGEAMLAVGEMLKRDQAKIEGPNIVARLEAHKKEAKELEKIAEKTTKHMEELHKHSLAEEKRAMEEWSRAAQRLADEARSPMEKFIDRLKELKEAFAERAIDLRQFGQLAAKAGAEVERAFNKHKELADHGMRAGIAAADISTSGGASLDISAGRALQDISMRNDAIQEQQLEQLKSHEVILQAIERNTGRPAVEFGVAGD
jgi:hypothetical protein